MKLVDLEETVKKVFYNIITAYNMKLHRNKDSLELSNSNCRITMETHRGELYFFLYMTRYDNLEVSPFLWGIIVNDLDKNGIILDFDAPYASTSESILYHLCKVKSQCDLFCKKLFDGSVSDSEIEKYINNEHEVLIEINNILKGQYRKNFP